MIARNHATEAAAQLALIQGANQLEDRQMRGIARLCASLREQPENNLALPLLLTVLEMHRWPRPLASTGLFPMTAPGNGGNRSRIRFLNANEVLIGSNGGEGQIPTGDFCWKYQFNVSTNNLTPLQPFARVSPSREAQEIPPQDPGHREIYLEGPNELCGIRGWSDHYMLRDTITDQWSVVHIEPSEGRSAYYEVVLGPIPIDCDDLWVMDAAYDQETSQLAVLYPVRDGGFKADVFDVAHQGSHALPPAARGRVMDLFQAWEETAHGSQTTLSTDWSSPSGQLLHQPLREWAVQNQIPEQSLRMLPFSISPSNELAVILVEDWILLFDLTGDRPSIVSAVRAANYMVSMQLKVERMLNWIKSVQWIEETESVILQTSLQIDTSSADFFLSAHDPGKLRILNDHATHRLVNSGPGLMRVTSHDVQLLDAASAGHMLDFQLREPPSLDVRISSTEKTMYLRESQGHALLNEDVWRQIANCEEAPPWLIDFSEALTGWRIDDAGRLVALPNQAKAMEKALASFPKDPNHLANQLQTLIGMAPD